MSWLKWMTGKLGIYEQFFYITAIFWSLFWEGHLTDPKPFAYRSRCCPPMWKRSVKNRITLVIYNTFHTKMAQFILFYCIQWTTAMYVNYYNIYIGFRQSLLYIYRSNRNLTNLFSIWACLTSWELQCPCGKLHIVSIRQPLHSMNFHLTFFPLCFIWAKQLEPC